MINTESLKKYIKNLFAPQEVRVKISKIGSGVQGTGFLVEAETGEGISSYVVKTLFSEGLEHDYPADRAGVFLLDLDEFKNLPNHVKAVDVLAELDDGSVKSIGGGREYYLLMERASGTDYFYDLNLLKDKDHLGELDINRIQSMTSYLAKIHSIKKDSKALYWRKVRDTIGHGECLMGVFDTYPEGILSFESVAEIEKKCVDWRARLKPRYKRLCQVHGDFHPGNIWFQGESDFILLDRSRGPWGDAADDLTALTMNYIFYSINNYGSVRGSYQEALSLFYEEYITETEDTDLLEVVAPFFAFRGAVVANPVFYPDVTEANRKKIINFVHGVLDDERFSVERVNEYLK